MKFIINTVLQDIIDEKRMKNKIRNKNRLGMTDTEITNLQEIEYAIYLMADVHYQEDNLDLDNFQFGYEFGIKASGKEIHAIEWDDGVLNGSGPEYIVFIGTLEEIKARINTIPNFSSEKKVILNDRRLTKDICLKCHYKYIDSCDDPTMIEIQLEQEWQLKGKLYCPAASIWGGEINIHESPPKECPYLVEHTVCTDAKTER